MDLPAANNHNKRAKRGVLNRCFVFAALVVATVFVTAWNFTAALLITFRDQS